MAPSLPSEIPGVCAQFPLPGDVVHAAPHGSGHINDTFAVTCERAGTPARFILQRINHRVFPDIAALMENIERVTRHVATKASAPGGGEIARRTLTLVSARNGRPWVVDPAGRSWRIYRFIEGAATHDILSSPQQAFAAGRAFGAFQRHLADLPGPRLHETIPAFHDTVQRLHALEKAIAADASGRAREVTAEIAFVLERRPLAGALLERHQRGAIPERITHNDTKLNNVMLDPLSGEGVCVIDLDTVMPGLAPYDFGDLIRSAGNSSAEDTTDPTTVHLQLPVFEAALHGYLGAAAAMLSQDEIAALPLAARVMTFEVGIRFLTDFLQGDVYYKIRRPRQNLDRCRTQFALLRSMEQQAAEVEALVHAAAK